MNCFLISLSKGKNKTKKKKINRNVSLSCEYYVALIFLPTFSAFGGFDILEGNSTYLRDPVSTSFLYT